MSLKKITGLFFFLLANVFFVNQLSTNTPTKNILIIHLFLFFLVFSTDLIQIKIKKLTKKNPYLSLSLNFFRAIVSVVFLLTTELNQQVTNKNTVINFMICYFVYTLVGVFQKSKKINA